jgi:hypothetical protein
VLLVATRLKHDATPSSSCDISRKAKVTGMLVGKASAPDAVSDVRRLDSSSST